jgi:hypothetical protein
VARADGRQAMANGADQAVEPAFQDQSRRLKVLVGDAFDHGRGSH